MGTFPKSYFFNNVIGLVRRSRGDGLVKRGRTTIKDIARLAGVSDSTVSRVLTNHPAVSEKTRHAVLAIVESSGYLPDSVARCLVTGRSNALAFITEDIRNPFFAEIARGVEDAAGAAGYHVIYCSTDGDLNKEKMYVELVIGYRVSGIIFTSFSGDADILSFAKDQGVPSVLVNRYFEYLQTDCVVVDNLTGAYEATKHLIDLGHKRIVHIGGGFKSSTSLERRAGYENALRDSGLAVDESIITPGNLRFHTGYEKALRLLESPGVTAIFAGNDLMAMGAWRACLEKDRSVPNDIAIVGFDDIELSSYPNVSLTTVRQPKYDLGRLSVELLLKRVCGSGNKHFEKVILPVELVIRKSSGRVH
jgi:Transcriptional regulators